MEHVLESNANLSYTEPTSAQLAAAAKVSIREMRGALAATAALSQVVTQGAAILSQHAARRNTGSAAQDAPVDAAAAAGPAQRSSEWPPQSWDSAAAGSNTMTATFASGAEWRGAGSAARGVWESLQGGAGSRAKRRNVDGDMGADVRRAWGESAPNAETFEQ